MTPAELDRLRATLAGPEAAARVAERAARGRLREETAWVEHALGRVRALSPRATLLRGYAIVTTDAGEPVDSTAAIAPGDGVVAMLADGTFHADITAVQTRRESDG